MKDDRARAVAIAGIWIGVGLTAFGAEAACVFVAIMGLIATRAICRPD